MATVRNLICSKGLGYCCPWIFFKYFKRTGMIADRLGVTPRAIRLHKAEFREGLIACEGRPNCMKHKLEER